jgi:hypothetical protein
MEIAIIIVFLAIFLGAGLVFVFVIGMSIWKGSRRKNRFVSSGQSGFISDDDDDSHFLYSDYHTSTDSIATNSDVTTAVSSEAAPADEGIPSEAAASSSWDYTSYSDSSSSSYDSSSSSSSDSIGSSCSSSSSSD